MTYAITQLRLKSVEAYSFISPEIVNFPKRLPSPSKGPKPVFIVDGKEVKKLRNTNPDEIESVNVLKGKAARKKYGRKGKNGVVEIITKEKN